MKHAILLLGMILGIITVNVNAQQRIVEGSTINITEAPWQAAIQVNGNWNGGGVILGPDLIITAEHVLKDCTTSQIKVGVGITQLSEATSYDLYGVQQIIRHPEYDIALLKLSRSLSYNSSVRAINILNAKESSFYNVGNIVRVTGYGRTKHEEDDPFGEEKLTRLRKTEIPIVSNSSLSGAKPQEFVIYNGKSAIGGGDSGGPVTIWDSSIQQYVVIGINARGDTYYSCAIRTSLLIDFLLPYLPLAINGSSDQVLVHKTIR